VQRASTYMSRELVSPKPRGWLCLSLALLFLYNPFLATPALGNGLCVHHSMSNRATVGASELQHFTAKERHILEAQVDGLTEEPLFSSVMVQQRFEAPNPEHRPPQTFWAANLWFRPPPIS